MSIKEDIVREVSENLSKGATLAREARRLARIYGDEITYHKLRSALVLRGLPTTWRMTQSRVDWIEARTEEARRAALGPPPRREPKREKPQKPEPRKPLGADANAASTVLRGKSIPRTARKLGMSPLAVRRALIRLEFWRQAQGTL
jgi:hypothetical protein